MVSGISSVGGSGTTRVLSGCLGMALVIELHRIQANFVYKTVLTCACLQ
jgi:hypothetical protein